MWRVRNRRHGDFATIQAARSERVRRPSNAVLRFLERFRRYPSNRSTLSISRSMANGLRM